MLTRLPLVLENQDLLGLVGRRSYDPTPIALSEQTSAAATSVWPVFPDLGMLRIVMKAAH